MNFWGTLGVIEFELKRTLVLSRILGALFLICFPAAMTAALQMRAEVAIPEVAFGFIISFLILQVTCGMTLLLLATTVINSELEGNTWTYPATRPSGRINVVLGKYVVAAVLSWVIGSLAVTGMMSVIQIAQAMRFWLVLLTLTIIASFAYGALFIALGTLFQRRAMAVAVVYMLLVEGVLGLIPASANQFTISYRLRSLMVQWMNWTNIPEGAQRLFGDEASWHHLLGLLIFMSIMLTASFVRVRWGEYPTNTQD